MLSNETPSNNKRRRQTLEKVSVPVRTLFSKRKPKNVMKLKHLYVEADSDLSTKADSDLSTKADFSHIIQSLFRHYENRTIEIIITGEISNDNFFKAFESETSDKNTNNTNNTNFKFEILKVHFTCTSYVKGENVSYVDKKPVTFKNIEDLLRLTKVLDLNMEAISDDPEVGRASENFPVEVACTDPTQKKRIEYLIKEKVLLNCLVA